MALFTQAQKSYIDRAIAGLRAAMGAGAQAWQFTSSAQITGTTPLLIGGFYLPAGSYAPISANLGCGAPSYAATVKLKTQAGATIASLSGSGGLSWKTASGGFTLATPEYVDVTLEANHPSATAYLRGFILTKA